jgi:hypothetical protein
LTGFSKAPTSPCWRGGEWSSGTGSSLLVPRSLIFSLLLRGRRHFLDFAQPGKISPHHKAGRLSPVIGASRRSDSGSEAVRIPTPKGSPRDSTGTPAGTPEPMSAGDTGRVGREIREAYSGWLVRTRGIHSHTANTYAQAVNRHVTNIDPHSPEPGPPLELAELRELMERHRVALEEQARASVSNKTTQTSW